MSKILLLLLFSGLLSCSKSVELSSSFQKTIINKTEKMIINLINTEVRTDSLIIKKNDSISVLHVKMSMSESVLFGIASTRPPSLLVYKDILYNLTDTTCYQFKSNQEYYNYTVYNADTFKGNDSIYIANLERHANNESETHPKMHIKLIINDPILKIMQKDYSMLEKFKEYYQK
jgi:hypothetical protein